MADRRARRRAAHDAREDTHTHTHTQTHTTRARASSAQQPAPLPGVGVIQCIVARSAAATRQRTYLVASSGSSSSAHQGRHHRAAARARLDVGQPQEAARCEVGHHQASGSSAHEGWSTRSRRGQTVARETRDRSLLRDHPPAGRYVGPGGRERRQNTHTTTTAPKSHSHTQRDDRRRTRPARTRVVERPSELLCGRVGRGEWRYGLPKVAGAEHDLGAHVLPPARGRDGHRK